MPTHRTGGRASRAALLLSTAGLLVATAPVLAQTAEPGASPLPTTAPGVVGAIPHPTEPTAIVLRMDSCCGFVPVEVSLTSVPTFTLYGDNSVVFRPSSEEFPPFGDPLPPLVKATLSPEQVDALLTFALEQGGLHDAAELYTQPLVADLPTTIFTINAADVAKTVSVQALGFEEGAPDAAIRAQFAQLADLLDSFEEQVAAGNVETAEPYAPELYRGILTDAQGMAPDAVAQPWPWTDVAPEDFQGPADGIARYAGLTSEQVAAVMEVPNGGITNILLDLPDGEGQVWLAIRPLLPDEDVLPVGVEPMA
jgi:hypothetical protein